jgi:hypothetical protein
MFPVFFVMCYIITCPLVSNLRNFFNFIYFSFPFLLISVFRIFSFSVIFIFFILSALVFSVYLSISAQFFVC